MKSLHSFIHSAGNESSHSTRKEIEENESEDC